VFRLTVGRRLAIVLALTILAIAVLVILVLRGQRDDAIDRSAANLEAIASPIASLIEGELNTASRLLELSASTPSDDATKIRQLEAAGFIAVEVLESVESPSRIGATTNVIDRSSTGTTIGATRILDGEVGVLIGAPVQNSTGKVIIGAYSASGILEAVAAARAGESTEVLLAVRNAEGEAVIFTPSRHNGDQPFGQPNGVTSSLIDEVLDGENQFDSDDASINGRQSVVTMRRIPEAEWVLIAATDSADTGADNLPNWLVPAFLVIGVLSLVPIAVMRTRLDSVVQGAQELYRDRLLAPLDDAGDDEIGMLSRTLQSLDDRLHTEAETRSRSAATLQHRASHDPLTGLANRARLMDELTISLNKRDGIAVLFCDIDGFKGINDSQGHAGGDIVLKFVADQLGSTCGSNDLIARFGGDEFCVLSHEGPQAARVLSGKVERALDTTCVVNGNHLRIGGSVGLAIAKITDTPDSILKSADLAMYREKERRRGLRQAARGSADIEIKPEQIRLVYQPVVEISDGTIVGVEVLARYMHPVMGMLDPSSFLPPGTERGEFDKFDLEILTRSIAQLSDWLSHGIVDERFTLSFNLKPDHVSDSDSTRQIFETLRQHRVPPTMLQIEVTEHRLFAHQDDLINSLNVLRERGIKVAIDDFGIEGSNVDRLIQIPSDTVKIDRSFISEIDVDERAMNRLKAIVEIVTTEGRVPIAEGVERSRQAEILKDMNVPFGQGFLWHAPISALALTPLLGRASRWTRRKPPPDTN
jgi:diguanylate cyclase (GGDEF)-like protein